MPQYQFTGGNYSMSGENIILDQYQHSDTGFFIRDVNKTEIIIYVQEHV